MVGAARFELATPRSQSECATNCATPRQNALISFACNSKKRANCFLLAGVSDGARTRDVQNHNLMLYQLSYAHHVLATRHIQRIRPYYILFQHKNQKNFHLF